MTSKSELKRRAVQIGTHWDDAYVKGLIADRNRIAEALRRFIVMVKNDQLLVRDAHREYLTSVLTEANAALNAD